MTPTPVTPALYATRPQSPPIPTSAAPAARTSRAVIAPALILFFSAFALGITALLTPRFEEVFRDFGAPLSELTRLSLAFGSAMRTPLGLLSIAAVLSLLCLASALLSYHRRAAFTLSILLTLALFAAYAVLFIVSMSISLTAMIESLQQGGTP